jgi:hypothetical protein
VKNYLYDFHLVLAENGQAFAAGVWHVMPPPPGIDPDQYSDDHTKWQVRLREKALRMRRCWINAPSTHQVDHAYHGRLVLAPEDSNETHPTVYFADGPVISARMFRASLSPGWPAHLVVSPASGAPALHIKKAFFRWNTDVRMTHQSGQNLARSRGVNVLLCEREGKIVCAEVYSDDLHIFAEIGLGFAGMMLTDYDGAFELPLHVAALLRFNGYDVSEIVEESDRRELEALTAMIV